MKYIFNKIILILLASIILSNMSFAKNNSKKNFPEFSWDTLPVCIHLFKKDDNFSEEQAKFISRFPLVCIEKQQAWLKYKNLEDGSKYAANQIKKYNKNIKVLFYWNSRIDYGSIYKEGKILDKKPEWAMTDKNNKLVLVRGHKTYDPSNPQFRRWWLDKAHSFLQIKNIDGIFVDATIQFMANQKAQENKNGSSKQKAVVAGLKTMLDDLDKENPNKFIIANSIRGNKAMEDNGLGLYKYIDASMMEHFCDLSCENKESIIKDIQLIQKSAQMEKAIVVKAWPSFNNFSTTKKTPKLPYSELEKKAREDIIFPLATFLVAAGKYAYFCYSWGYGEKDGGFIDYKEYSKALGEPLSDAKKQGYIYTRKFKNASVWVDVENRKAKISWK